MRSEWLPFRKDELALNEPTLKWVLFVVVYPSIEGGWKVDSNILELRGLHFPDPLGACSAVEAFLESPAGINYRPIIGEVLEVARALKQIESRYPPSIRSVPWNSVKTV